MLVFDNGRLKQATYDTAQGFGLRAVKDEAVGYAHASDLSEAATGARGRGGARRQGRLFRPLCRAARPHQCAPLRRRQSARRAGLRDQGEAAGDDRRLCARARIRACGRSRSRSARPGRWSRSCAPTARRYRDVRPLVRVNVSVVAGDGDRQETGSHGYGGREGFERFIETQAWQGAVDEAVRQALVNLEAVPAPAGEMDVVLGPGWPGVMLHEAVGHGLEGDFNRKKTSAFAGLMGQQVAVEGRHRGRRRHHRAAPRLALDRRRGHADQPHRADRGRHPRRLHAGPPERAPHGHEADRQRPPRKATPMCRCRA